MKLIRIAKSGYKIVIAHKIRSMFMVLSVVIGIAALTVVISLGKGTEQKIIGQVKKFFSSNTIMVVAGKARIESNRMSGLSNATLKLADFEEIKNNLSDIIEWDAVQIAPEKTVTYSGNNSIGTLSGHTVNGESVWNIEVKEGRFFTETEDKNLARVALLAPNISRDLFGVSNPVGQEIKIDNIPFQIIGVIGPRGMDPHGIDKDSEILVPLNTLMRRVVNLNFLMLGKVLVANEKNISSTAEEITQILRRRHSVSGDTSDDFMIVTPTIVREMIKSATRIFNLYLPLIAFIALLVGSIVVANLMLLSVNERKSEIGLRLAVGAKTRDVLFQFLLEATSITILSGILGITIGLIALKFIYPIMSLQFTIQWGTLAMCFVISSVIGIATGLIPARNAAKLNPVDALR
jgi:putative ABC transport system permease protein